MKKEDKELIIDLLFAKYKENKDEYILDLIKKIEKINYTAQKLVMTNSSIDLKREGTIDLTDLYFDVLDLSNVHLEMNKEKIKIRDKVNKKIVKGK